MLFVSIEYFYPWLSSDEPKPVVLSDYEKISWFVGSLIWAYIVPKIFVRWVRPNCYALNKIFIRPKYDSLKGTKAWRSLSKIKRNKLKFMGEWRRYKKQQADEAYMNLLTCHEKHLVNNGLFNQKDFQLISVVMRNRKIYVGKVQRFILNHHSDTTSVFYLIPFYTGYRSEKCLEFKLENTYTDNQSASPVLLKTSEIESLNDFNLEVYIKLMRDKQVR